MAKNIQIIMAPTIADLETLCNKIFAEDDHEEITIVKNVHRYVNPEDGIEYLRVDVKRKDSIDGPKVCTVSN